MPVAKATRDALLDFVASVVEQGTPPDLRTLLDSAHMTRSIPDRLAERSDRGSPTLVMGGDDYRKFREALFRLVHEPELEHLTEKEVDAALWELCCELVLQKADFQKSAKRLGRINNFLNDILRPHTNFEVAVLLENLQMESSIELGGVNIRQWQEADARDWSILPTDDLSKDFIDKPVAFATVQAGSASKAIERARRSIEDTLDMLRLGIIASLFMRSHDNQNMFRQGELELVREEGGSLSHRWSYLHRAYPTMLNQPTVMRTLEYLQPLRTLLDRPDLRKDMKDRLTLAIHWFGAATAAFSYDEKVIGLCTAFESLFTDRSDVRKGELIALRTMLLQGAATSGFTDTFPQLRLYVIRSYLVHGSERGLCEESHYRILHGDLLRMMKIYVDYLAAHPEIRSFTALKRSIETQEWLEAAVKWFAAYGEDAKDLVAEAESILQRMRQATEGNS